MVDFDSILACEWFTGASPFGISFNLKNPKVCVITGGNATGKSLLRKIIYNDYQDRNVELMHLSMDARCRPGMHRIFLYGAEADQATGHNTVKGILDAVKTSKAREARHSLLFDEPEIGCSDEVAAGIGFYLAGILPTLHAAKLDCCYIISHNRYLIREILPINPSHVHLMGDSQDYVDLKTWVDRPVQPIYNLDTVVQKGIAGWRFVQQRINENRKTKKG